MINLKQILVIVIGLLTSIVSYAQNSLLNGDFESNGGSLDSWVTTSNTEIGINGADHYARIYGENGVLYQKIGGLVSGSIYECTIKFITCSPKQTSGFGYAIENSTTLTIPTFTSGATQLKPFCESNGGLWTNLTVSETNVQKKFTVVIPTGATAIYICIGTKGAIANFTVSEVVFELKAATDVSFVVKSNNTKLVLPNAEIYVPELLNPASTNNLGNATLKLIPRELPYDITVKCDWYKTFNTQLTVSQTMATTEIQLDTLVEVKKVETRISKYGDNATPYPLYGHFWNSGLNFSNNIIDKLTSGFDYIIGGSSLPGSTSTVNSIKQKAPKFQIIRYSGGWSTNYSYAEQNKNSLAYYRAGTLSNAIDQASTTFTINEPPSTKGRGLIASEPGKFDSWLRVENELMKVLTVSSNTTYPITVTVERGFEGTTATSHVAGKATTLPLYGGAPPVAGQASTNRNYFINCYGLRKENLTSAINNAILTEQFDGIWIDILIGKLDAISLYNNGYDEWDHNSETVLSATNDVKYTKTAIAQLYEKFYAQNGYYPVIYGNNVLYTLTLNESARAYAMVKTTEHPKVIDGFCHENSWGHMTDVAGTVDNDGIPVPTADVYKFVGSNNHFLELYMGNTWANNSKAISLLAQNNLPNQPMTINAGFKNQWFASDLTDEIRYNFNKYAYASYLMCVNVTADSLISCRMGISPMVSKNGILDITIEPFFYYPIGIPTQNLASTSFTNYKISGANLYARRFSNGIVLINPFQNDMPTEIPLDQITTGNYTFFDPENNNEIVSQIKLKSREAKLLLFEPNTVGFKYNKTSLSKIEVYPIPAHDLLVIKMSSSDILLNKISFTEIIDQTGRACKVTPASFENGNAVIDISTLNPGIYFLRVPYLNKVVKFIKN